MTLKDIIETYEATLDHLQDIDEQLYDYKADNNTEMIELITNELEHLKESEIDLKELIAAHIFDHDYREDEERPSEETSHTIAQSIVDTLLKRLIRGSKIV